MGRVVGYLGAFLRDAMGDAHTARVGFFAETAVFGLLFSVVGTTARNLIFTLLFGFLAAASFVGWWRCSDRRKAVGEAYRARASRRPEIVERALDRDS